MPKTFIEPTLIQSFSIFMKQKPMSLRQETKTKKEQMVRVRANKGKIRMRMKMMRMISNQSKSLKKSLMLVWKSLNVSNNERKEIISFDSYRQNTIKYLFFLSTNISF